MLSWVFLYCGGPDGASSPGRMISDSLADGMASPVPSPRHLSLFSCFLYHPGRRLWQEPPVDNAKGEKPLGVGRGYDY